MTVRKSTPEEVAPVHPIGDGKGEAHVIDEGEGTPLLLLHGWGVNTELFAPLIAAQRTHHRVIAPDLPGFGLTPPPASPWCVDDYVEWVANLCKERGVVPCDVIGHSNGGRIAMAAAVKYPNLFRRIVLTGASGIRPPRTFSYHLRVRWFRLLGRVVRSRVAPGLLKAYGERVRSRSGSSDYRAATGVMRDTFVRFVNDDLTQSLPRVTTPTLLVWGDNDTETPLATGKKMEQLIPGATLIVLQGGSHFAYLEQAARFSRIVDAFLESP